MCAGLFCRQAYSIVAGKTPYEYHHALQLQVNNVHSFISVIFLPYISSVIHMPVLEPVLASHRLGFTFRSDYLYKLKDTCYRLAKISQNQQLLDILACNF